MLVFPNSTVRWTDAQGNQKSAICYIKATDKSNTSRSDDGSFGITSYIATLNVSEDTKDFGNGYVEIYHNEDGYLGTFSITSKEKLEIVGSYKLTVELRPHTISKLVPSTHYDDDGNIISNDVVETFETPCLYKRNERAETVNLEDGVAFVYSYKIELNRDCEYFKAGDSVRIYNSRKMLVEEKTVKGFSRGLLISTVWL